MGQKTGLAFGLVLADCKDLLSKYPEAQNAAALLDAESCMDPASPPFE